MGKFTTNELVLLNVAGPIFTINSEVDSNTCNLRIEPWEGQVHEINIKKIENHFDIEVLINGEVIDKFDCVLFGELLGLVRSLDNQFFEFFVESFDEEDSEQTSEYLA